MTVVDQGAKVYHYRHETLRKSISHPSHTKSKEISSRCTIIRLFLTTVSFPAATEMLKHREKASSLELIPDPNANSSKDKTYKKNEKNEVKVVKSGN